MSPFISRVLVAIAALPVVLGVVWLGGWWLGALALGGTLLALHEFWAMTRPLRPIALAGYVGATLAVIGAELGGIAWALGGFMLTLALALVLHSVAETRAPATASFGITVLGAAWIGLGVAHVVLLRALPRHGQLVVFTVLLSVFAADTFAYFGGRMLGRHKLAPVLSPSKTWEGFVAGSLAAIFVAFIALYKNRHTFIPVWQAVVLGVVIAAAAFLGDLFVSALKRDMQVKDTGHLLGGHGGVLDRLDSLAFAFVAAYYVLRAFGAA